MAYLDGLEIGINRELNDDSIDRHAEQIFARYGVDRKPFIRNHVQCNLKWIKRTYPNIRDSDLYLETFRIFQSKWDSKNTTSNAVRLFLRDEKQQETLNDMIDSLSYWSVRNHYIHRHARKH